MKYWKLPPLDQDKIKMSTLNISIQYCTRHPSQDNKVEKEKKVSRIGKGKVKISFIDDMMLYIENSKESTNY